ncbi:MAG TPA: DUF4349 domain-containing protein [Bacteroidia bacterium]|jgi:hypothetical protein
MKKTQLLYPVLVISLFSGSCNDASKSMDSGSAEHALKMDAPPPMSEAISITASEDKKAGSGSAEEGAEKNNQPVLNSGHREKIPEKIKKTANINITVDDYKESRSAIRKIVSSGQGYISGENEQNNTYNITNSMVIRVLNHQFESMVENISAIGGHVNSKNVYTEDVTAQFVDITARLKSKKEVEKRYLDILQKAGKVSDILEVEDQLRVIREEIEAKEGQLKYLNDQVGYSTIYLTFHQDYEYTPEDRPGFLGRLGHAFGNGWNGFLSFLVGLVYAWPLWIMLSAGGYFLYRFVKRRLKK